MTDAVAIAFCQNFVDEGSSYLATKVPTLPREKGFLPPFISRSGNISLSPFSPLMYMDTLAVVPDLPNIPV